MLRTTLLLLYFSGVVLLSLAEHNHIDEDSYREPLELCSKEPKWLINDRDVMKEYRGKVTVLITMQLHCDNCRRQMMQLQQFAGHLSRENMLHELVFIIVAPSNQSHQWLQLWRSQMHSHSRHFEIHRENLYSSVWHRMNSNNRDVFVYDRCGRLTYFIEGAQSLLSHHHHIASAIFNTFYHQPCGYCQHDPRHELRKHGHTVPEPSSSEALDFWSRFIRAQHRSGAYKRPIPDLPSNPLPTAATIIRQLSVTQHRQPTVRSDAAYQSIQEETNQQMYQHHNDPVYVRRPQELRQAQTENCTDEDNQRQHSQLQYDHTTIRPYYHYPDRVSGREGMHTTPPPPRRQHHEIPGAYHQRPTVVNRGPTRGSSYTMQQPQTNYEWHATTTTTMSHTTQRPRMNYEWYATTTTTTTTRQPWRQLPTTTRTPLREQIPPTQIPLKAFTSPLRADEEEQVDETQVLKTQEEQLVEHYQHLLNPKLPTDCYPVYQYHRSKIDYDMPIFDDRKCFEMQMEDRQSEAFQKCCYKGIYLTDVCSRENCIRAGEQAYKMCCLQKFVQARYRCCHNEELTGESADEFSKCCYENLVWLDGDDECCPREFTQEYWSKKSNLYQLCLPNVDVDYSPIIAKMPLQFGREAVLNMSAPITKRTWQHSCPYESKRQFFYYYQPQPLNLTVPMQEDKNENENKLDKF